MKTRSVESKQVIIIGGPTGVGKSALAVNLAKQIDGEIVSCDSVQVYRGMDIGTAKVSQEIRKVIPHHLIDIRDIKDTYHVADFYKDARSAILDIQKRGKVPIVVGGTGFYLHILLYGPPKGPPADLKIRAILDEECIRLGISHLFERLQTLDPIYAAKVSKNDAHKILRGLEIIEISKQTVSSFMVNEEKADPDFDFHCWFVYFSRDKLYPNLEKRCDEMLVQGFLEEVIKLDKEGLRKNSIASCAIGYKHALEFLDTDKTSKDYDEFLVKFKAATRQFAKRQFTWFRNKEKLFKWVDLSLYTHEEVLKMMQNSNEAE